MCIQKPETGPVIREMIGKLKDCLVEAGRPVIEHYIGHIKSYFRKDANGKIKINPKNHQSYL